MGDVPEEWAKVCKSLHKKEVYLRSNKNGNMLQEGSWQHRACCSTQNRKKDQKLHIEYTGQHNLVFIVSAKSGKTMHFSKQGHISFEGKDRGDAEMFRLDFRGEEAFIQPRHSRNRAYVRDDCVVGAYSNNGVTWGKWESFTILNSKGKPAHSPVHAKEVAPAPAGPAGQGVDANVSALNGKLVWLVSKHTGNVLQNDQNGNLRAACTNMLGWEQLTIEYSGRGNVVFLVSGKDGHTLQCTPKGELKFANKNRGGWEQFGLEMKGADVFLVSIHTNKTIQVQKDGVAQCANQNRLAWEAFTLVHESKTGQYHAQNGNKARLEDCWTAIVKSLNGATGYAKSNFNGKVVENHGGARAIGDAMGPRGQVTVEHSGERNIVFLVSKVDGHTLHCTDKGELVFASKNKGACEKFRLECHGASVYFVSCHTNKTMQVRDDGTLACTNENRLERESFQMIPHSGPPSAPAQPTPGSSSADAQRPPPAESKLCPSCESKNPPDARFCSKCGKGVTDGRVCGKCHAECPLDASFCNKCGHDLLTPEVQPVVHVGVPAMPSAPPQGQMAAFPVAPQAGISPFPVSAAQDGQPQFYIASDHPEKPT